MPRVPKVRESVTLPPRFVEFMRDVAQMIELGDDATTTTSDDLLQCECVCGGLVDEAKRQFYFCYFHDGDAKLYFSLNARQIARVAAGKLTQVKLWRCGKGKCGCYYTTEDSYCHYCDSIWYFADFESDFRRAYSKSSDAMIDAMLKLQRIVLGLFDYMKERDWQAPPPFTTNEKGKRLHSWRALILPYLELDELFQAIDFSQPWNAPVNQALAAQAPDIYRMPGSATDRTQISAIVGPKTFWPTDRIRKTSDVKSGLSYTFALVAAPSSHFGWMEPNDLTLETLIEEATAPGANLLAAMLDGCVGQFAGESPKKIRELASV